MSPIYVGIDIADQASARSRVTLADEGETLFVQEVLRRQYGAPLQAGDWAALDSPLGYPLAFLGLVQNLEVAGIQPRAFKYRRTEEALSTWIGGLPLVQQGNEQVDEFFNSGSHIKPTLGLQIVPGAMKEVLRLCGAIDAPQDQRQVALRQARLGIGPVIEAHPRLFLYSAMARISAAQEPPLPDAMLLAARSYKDNQAHREAVLAFLVHHQQEWLGDHHLDLDGADLVTRDHDFDAFLCAVTAFSHAKGHTLTWEDLADEMPEEVVAVEGHILVLHQAPLGGAP